MATAENATGTEAGNLVVGKVVILYGNVKAISSDGTIRVLAVNSPIFTYDRVITESDGMVSIAIDDGAGTHIDLGRMSDVFIDEDIFAGVSAEEVSEAAAEVEQIQEALLAEDFDPTTELEAPAAGGAASAGGGHPVPEFVRVTHEGEVTSGAETTGITTDTVEPIDAVFEAVPSSTPPDAFQDEISKVEGGQGFMVENGELYDGNLTDNDLSNDGPLHVISIEVGGETYQIPADGSVTVVTPLGGDLTVDSDGSYKYIPPAFVDHTATGGEPVSEVFSYTVENSNGDTDSSTLTVNILDTAPTAAPDTDTVTEDSVLTAEGNVITDTEGDGGADGLAADPVDVTLINGVSVTAGTTSADGTEIAGDYGTLTIGADGSYIYSLNNNASAVQGLGDGETLNETFQYTITDIDGNSDTSTLNILINGTNDLAVVNVNDVTVFEGSGTVTITATIDNAPHGSDLVLTLSNGATITIGEGETSGTSTPFAIQGDDPYIDGESYTVSVTDFSGGFLDNINTSDTATLTINDTIDTTTVTLDNVTVNEDQTITYTASVDNAPQGSDLVLTLSNGAVITIAENQTSGSSDPYPAQGDDPYLDSDSQPLSISSAVGGNYENLDTSDTATLTINDTIDTTYVSIAGPANVVEGETTGDYTLTLSNAPQGDVTVNLTYSGVAADGTDFTGVHQVTFNTLSTTFTIPTIIDAAGIEGPESFTITIVDDVTGGNFEEVHPDPVANYVETTIIEPLDTAASVEESDMDLNQDGIDLAASTSTGTTPTETGETVTGSLNLQDGWTAGDATGTTAYGSYSIDSSTGTYTYTLVNSAVHDTPPSTDDVIDSFSYDATSVDGVTVSNTVTISIIDDSPTIDVSNLAIPNIETTYEGTYSFDVGADAQPFNVSIDADSLTWNGAPEGWSLENDAASSTPTSQVYVTTYNDAPTDFFTVTIYDDGTYDFSLDEAKPVTVSDPVNILQGISGGSGLAEYIFGSELFGGYFELVVTGESNGVADTLSISSTDLGVSDNVIQEMKGDTLRFDMNPEAGFDDSITVTKLTVSISNTASIKDGVDVHLHVVYTDGTEGDSYQPYYKAAGGDVIFDLDDTKTLDYFTLANDETDSKDYSFKIDGISLEYQVTTYPDDYDLHFTLEGTDGDNDSASANFSVFVNTADECGHYDISGSPGHDIIYGTSGSDTIHADQGGDDIIFAGGGNDTIYVNDGDANPDYVDGGDGYDTSYADNIDSLVDVEDPNIS